ncbi:hypothetical protein ROE7235_03769 [Roseibaca ekhonensis]|uniref:Ribosome modulation factor n=1 Tax=Roseinatronobacter ekhonensis TaxID=254356 RepID=A0A3B0MKB7_9RHOB|nr:hypothetical protein [Roseibaca ekhonensis]SUZ33988.1 hypothetical protein ROE7235_03769 [Roseibaca ekhonensis]
MSADYDGRSDGRRDAEFDTGHDFPRKPRPRFLPSLLSDRYRLAYMASYKRHYDFWLRNKEGEISRELAQNSKLISGEQVPRDQVYERGWRDGFDGKDTPPKELAHEEIRTYERGHRMGRQHREYELADQLRKQSQRQHHR